jgi:hypothetical protein
MALSKYPVIRDAQLAARKMFYGMASGAKLVECNGEHIDGVEYFIGEDGVRCVWSETVTRFPKSRGSKSKHKHDPRFNVEANDNMIIAVGKPGSRERLDALQAQYAAIEAGQHDVSPFRDE